MTRNILDPVRNFAIVMVAQGYGAGATSIALISGDGAKIPDPATEGAFNGVWYDATHYPDIVSDPNKEIVRIIAKSADTLTIIRQQEGSLVAAHSFVDVQYKIAFGITAKFRNDIEGALQSLSGNLTDQNVLLPTFSDNINNSPAVTKQALYIAASSDGKRFNTLTGEPVYNPGFLRDPSIIKDANGVYWIAHTNSYTSNNFSIISSPDLLNWTHVTDVDMSAISPYNTWAPEFFVDDDGSVHVFVACATTSDSVGFQIYEVHPTNAGMTAWSAPVHVTGTQLSGIDTIDPFIVKKSGVYYLWYKRYSGSPAIEYASSSSLLSGYDSGKTGDWAAWSNTYLEGPALIELPDGTWRIYFDNSYVGGTPNLQYSESSDNWITWSAAVDIIDPFQFKHCTPFVVSDIDSIRKMVMLKLQSQGLRLGGGLHIRNRENDSEVVWIEDASGNPLFRIDQNGNVRAYYSTTLGGYVLQKATSGNDTQEDIVGSDTTHLSWIDVMDSASQYYVRMIQQGSAATSTDMGIAKAGNSFLFFQPATHAVMGTKNSTPFGFGTNNVERFRIPAAGLTQYADNAAAVSGGLGAGDLYLSSADPHVLCVVV